MNEALDEAQRAERPVLINCFARWAGPSVLMDSLVLREPALEAWISRHFVPLRLNMQTPEGKDVANRYGVDSYAYFLVLTPKGEVQHRISGGSRADEFRSQLEEALIWETSLRGSKQLVERPEATAIDTLRYLRALRRAGDAQVFREVGEMFAVSRSPEMYLQSDYWVCAGLVMKYMTPHFEYMLDHFDDFVKAHGRDAVTRIVESAMARHLLPWAEGKIQFLAPRSDLEKMLTVVERTQLPDTCATSLLAELSRLRSDGLVQECLQLMRAKGHALRAYPNVRANLELTFSFPSMTHADTLAVVAYLNEAVQRERGRSSRQLADFRDALLQGFTPEKGGVEFLKVPFGTAQQKADAEGKLIFVDCMTSWCGPCRGMSRDVFPLPRVGEYMNPRFVSLKIDMEKGEGPELARRYAIQAYPTMLVLRSDGTEVKRIVGYKSAEMLLDALKLE